MTIHYAEVTNSEVFEPEIETLMASGLAPGSRAWLRFLVDLTIESKGNHEPFDERKLAERFYGDPAKYNTASKAIGKLRKAVDRYYAQHRRAFRLRINVRHCSVGYEGQLPEIKEPTIRKRLEEDHGISVDEFRQFLILLCDLEDTTLTDRLDIAQGLCYTSRIDPPPDDAFDRLFSHYKAHRDKFVLSEMYRIVDAFKIHPIMLDPLLTKAARGAQFLQIHFPATSPLKKENPSPKKAGKHALAAATFELANAPRERSYGKRTRYHIPDLKLKDTDPAFIYLVLRPPAGEVSSHARSDEHHHPGEEWLFVLKGKVEVRLADSGANIVLEKFCYAHFYAEQTHAAHYLEGEGESREAHVLIIRLYQRLPNPTSREAMRQRLWEDLRSDGEIDTHDAPLVAAWIAETAATRSIKSGRTLPPKEISNRLGFARFLMNYRTTQKSSSRYSDDWLSRVARGLAKVTLTEIPDIRRAFGVPHLFLWEFLFPGVPREVVVREFAKPLEGYSNWINLERLADDETLKYLPVGQVKYLVPSRSLACSDLSVVWIELEPEKSTPAHQHQGSELLIPMEGSVTLLVDGKPICSVAAGQSMAHYFTDKQHCMSNNSDKARAKVLVLRFLAVVVKPSNRHET
jgi:quercetin dioxygenase-like cupin family protein